MIGGTELKAHMKRQLKAFLLVMLCIVLVVPAMNVSAATQRQKAMAAYKKYLSQSKVYVMPKGTSYSSSHGKYTYSGTSASQAQFCIANIDGDGIPELIISAKYAEWYFCTVLTYKNGKINRTKFYKATDFVGYYPKTGIYLIRQAFVESHYVKGCAYCDGYVNIKNGKWVLAKEVQTSGETQYFVDGRPCKLKDFAAGRTRKTGGTSLVRAKFLKNTAANRNQKLK